MKLASQFFLAVFLLINLKVWAGGDHVNNGGGLGEKNVIYAYEKLESYIRLCLKAESCKLSDSQKEILSKIALGLNQDKSPTQLSFMSEQNQPGQFLIDGNVRVAKTGRDIGSPIIVNIDMLYTRSVSGVYEAVTVPEAVAILVHEFGHHYGHYSHDELDFLGVRVSLFLQTQVISTPLVPWKSDISMVVINHDDLGLFPEVLLYVGSDIIDVSAVYQAAVRCEGFKLPIPFLPIPDIPLGVSPANGSIFHNLHWEKIKDRDTSLDIQITGNVSNRCQSKSLSEIRNNSSQLTIKFHVDRKDDSWAYDSSSLTMLQFQDQWWKFIKLPR